MCNGKCKGCCGGCSAFEDELDNNAVRVEPGKKSREQIAHELFDLANALAGNETEHLACVIHMVVSELWAMDKKKGT